MYFDSHCHFDFAAYEGKRRDLWTECQQGGVLGLVIPGVSPAQWTSLPSICGELNSQFDADATLGVHYAVGLHPWWIDDKMRVDEVGKQLRSACDGAIAIGETGLDQTRHAEHVPLARQRAFLEAHIALASELGLPLILHCIGAHDTMLQVLRDNPIKSGGIVHSFSGSVEVAERYLALGLHLSFSCSAIRFGEKKRSAIACVPDDRLLIETDAPDQSAEKGRTGNPLDVVEVARTVAHARSTALATIADLTAHNARSLFVIEP